jgi:hypothetical protein
MTDRYFAGTFDAIFCAQIGGFRSRKMPLAELIANMKAQTFPCTGTCPSDSFLRHLSVQQ